jgi:hypothetical protein
VGVCCSSDRSSPELGALTAEKPARAASGYLRTETHTDNFDRYLMTSLRKILNAGLHERRRLGLQAREAEIPVLHVLRGTFIAEQLDGTLV